MLTRFEVTNFKSFKEKFVFDFTNTNDYQFNLECVKNAAVNKAIIYGANGSGKSNLGLAIFDIVRLTDKNFDTKLYKNYLNANLKNDLAEFNYVFNFKGNSVEYSYGKSDLDILVYEYLKINNELIISLDRRKSSKAYIKIEGAENLNTEMGSSKISIINYVKNNTVRVSNTINNTFEKFIEFINKMLLFESVEKKCYLGFENGSWNVLADIIEHDNVQDFEEFLNQAGIECKLKIVDRNGKPSLDFIFNEKNIFVDEVSSTGTYSLQLFYFWLQRLRENNKVSFVFIDEFDAFYHHALSKIVVKELKNIDAQVILTTHNTSIMTNDLMRPDCYFLMTKEKIKSLSQCTEKELRLAHNIEKIYRADGFHV